MIIATIEKRINMVMPVPTYRSLSAASEVKPSPAKARKKLQGFDRAAARAARYNGIQVCTSLIA